MCNGRFFHKWSKWIFIERLTFTNEKKAKIKIVCTQQRKCEICDKIEVSVTVSEI